MVHIITDNAANLPKALQEQYGIEELCLTYTVDGVPADTSVEFDGRGFYDALRHGASVQTSMVTPDAAQKGTGRPASAPVSITSWVRTKATMWKKC